MSCLVERCAVQKEQVVRTVTSMDMETGKKFGAGSHSGKVLEGLYDVRRTHESISSVDVPCVDSFQTGRGSLFCFICLCGHHRFLQRVYLRTDQDGVSGRFSSHVKDYIPLPYVPFYSRSVEQCMQTLLKAAA